MSGRVVHFELPASDTERATGFYSEAFGWRIAPMPGMDYATVGTVPTDDSGTPTEPGAINGGLLPRTEAVSGPVIVVDVPDIDETLARIEKLGGRTVRPRFAVASLGFGAYFADPDGNVIGLWQNA